MYFDETFVCIVDTCVNFVEWLFVNMIGSLKLSVQFHMLIILMKLV